MPVEERTVHEWPQAIWRDFSALFLGERLGGGLSREVFVCATNPAWVVKIETGEHRQNIMEQLVWDVVSGEPNWGSCETWRQWFAPVVRISPDGRALIQARTYPAPKSEPFPKSVPDFLADVRPCNWGWLKGRWVCHDYGFSWLLARGFKRARLVSTPRDFKERS